MADLAGMCRCEVLLTSFGENSDTDTDKDTDNCCDVCKQLKSIIKKSGHYSIQGVYHVLTKANKDLASEDSRILLYKAPEREITSQKISTKKSRCNNSEPGKAQSSRVGKGTHGLVVVRNLLTDKENWIVPNTESEWQFPGKFSDKESNKHEQCVIFVEDYRSVYPTCPKNLDSLWSDIQLSKGKVNNYKQVLPLMERKYQSLIDQHLVMESRFVLRVDVVM